MHKAELADAVWTVQEQLGVNEWKDALSGRGKDEIKLLAKRVLPGYTERQIKQIATALWRKANADG
jgi:hypothetical protein